MSDIDRDVFIEQTFDTVASGYDHPALSFFDDTAVRMIDHLGLAGDEKLLDVCTGTGKVSLRAANALTRGQVTGVDRSTGMLGQARLKADSAGLDNIEFKRMDMRSLDFPEASFDVATCSFGLFFIEEMSDTLEHISSRVKSGGKLAISTFSLGAFEPCSSRFRELMESYGHELPTASWEKIATENELKGLFEAAGLPKVKIHQEPFEYNITADVWWNIIWNAGYRGFLSLLSEADLAEFKRQHSTDINNLCAEGGLLLKVGVMIAVAQK